MSPGKGRLRIRRVKCGEEKPQCARCTTTGRKCDYEGTFLIIDKPLSLSPNTVWRERRSFAYYFQNAASSIGGGLDGDFWNTIVPKVCRNEPAVWDAIISISALFESPEPCPELFSIRRGYLRPSNAFSLNQNHQDALSWYSRSVSTIRQRIESGRLDIFVGLITCILFISIEALQGGVEEGLQLYNQGVQLVLNFRAQIATGTVPVMEAAWLDNTIVPILIRLGSFGLPLTKGPLSILLSNTEYDSAQHFDSLRSAREALVLLSADVQIFQIATVEYTREHGASKIPQDFRTQQAKFLAKLKSWHKSFTKLMTALRSVPLSSQQIGIGSLLFAHHEVIYIILCTTLTTSQTITDEYIPNFQTIVDESALAFTATARPDGTQPPFTFEMSVVNPLWFTCLRCREPRIRRKALALLRRAPLVQGFYKTKSAISFSERVMALEEQYGMAITTSRHSTPESPTSEITSHSNYHSPGAYHLPKLDLADFLKLDFKYSTSLESMPVELEMAPTSEIIPEEARMGPINMFRPRDGFPRGTTAADLAKVESEFGSGVFAIFLE
ncbi:C6 zinc finger domain protein [Penicillium maclennaniae]|uniref:C6 zinc finger domain protein n=1 Tax=Penicillium maclennaniae TaxID=1343394 RepID=UPI002540B66D|nr:C6 zinc finger domain protein [Penicillium maclennaniae]KAJ5665737.1 C6 zinc finger domain protein [Penicillium maclennaniae]